MMMTTNLHIDEWTEVFESEKLNGALLESPRPSEKAWTSRKY